MQINIIKYNGSQIMNRSVFDLESGYNKRISVRSPEEFKIFVDNEDSVKEELCKMATDNLLSTLKNYNGQLDQEQVNKLPELLEYSINKNVEYRNVIVLGDPESGETLMEQKEFDAFIIKNFGLIIGDKLYLKNEDDTFRAMKVRTEIEGFTELVFSLKWNTDYYELNVQKK